MPYIMAIRLLPLRSKKHSFLQNQQYLCIIITQRAMGLRKMSEKYIDELPQIKITLSKLKIPQYTWQSIAVHL